MDGSAEKYHPDGLGVHGDEENFREKVRKIAVCGFSFASRNLKWGDIEVRSNREFFNEIYEGLSRKDPMREAVPESYPLLRAIQMSAWATKKPRVARKH